MVLDEEDCDPGLILKKNMLWNKEVFFFHERKDHFIKQKKDIIRFLIN